MRAPPRRQALLPLLLILLLVFCIVVLVCLLQSLDGRRPCTCVLLECLCLGATLLRCLVVVLIQYLGDISHALCFGTLFILAELRSFSLLAIILRSINST